MPTLGGIGPVPHHPHEVRSSDGTTSPAAANTGADAQQGAAAGTAQLQQRRDARAVAVASKAKAEEAVGVMTWAAQQVAGWMMGIGTAAVLLFYQLVVDPAPPNSLPVRLFTSAARGERTSLLPRAAAGGSWPCHRRRVCRAVLCGAVLDIARAQL
jgi:hypothetical protein